MRPDDPHHPPRPSMGDILPRTRYERPPTALPTVQDTNAGAPPHAMADVKRATPDASHMLAPPHHPALEAHAHTDIPLEPPVLNTPGDTSQKPRRKKRWILWVSLLIFLALAAGASVIGGKWWYDEQLKPVSSDESVRVRVTIESGSTPDQISKLLQSKGVIRSDLVFILYTQEKGVQNQLQAGTYSLRPSESLADIVTHLVGGNTDEFSMTFLPGDTLANNRERFIKAGYTAEEVDAALSQAYDHPALASKPATADLEGYIYGETYSFTGDATPTQIITRTLDELDKQIVKYDLVNAYKKQGLTLYQGITLASIIQREVSGEQDEKQVAQVFLKRLKDGMPLGSDVTYIYAAKKMGVTATPALDSPYNTRIHKGLPPGPISVPGLSALRAVAAPLAGDYNYFLAGDDGKTYFARTYAEHEANITNHCQKGCQ